MNKTKFSFQIIILIISALVARLIAFYFYGDNQLENEWKILVNNLSEKGILGFYVTDENLGTVPKVAKENEVVLPSVFMPPLYTYFLFIIKSVFSNFVNFINIILFFQIFISIVSSYLFFKIIQSSYNLNTSFYVALIFSLVPINVYASVQISSISIQVFLLVYYFYILKIFSIKKNINYKDLFIFSIISGFLILLRGEFILFFLLSLIYFFYFYERRIKLFIISMILTLLIVSPYLMRNYYQFNTFTITKSFGYNLLKGNNPNFKVEGNPTYIETEFERKELDILINNKYEINLDNFYKEKAIENIKLDPLKYLLNYFKKILSFLTIDINSSYENYYNIFHIIPKLMLSVLSLFGGIIALKRRGFLQYLSIYYFSTILFFSIFFILPRYSLILLPVQILLSLEFLKSLLRKFIN
tara:strand:- start:4802 stop:6046 length:1245 start_codon:yes stop_codon:yes gene_type:complete